MDFQFILEFFADSRTLNEVCFGVGGYQFRLDEEGHLGVRSEWDIGGSSRMPKVNSNHGAYSPSCMFGSPLNSGFWQSRPIQLPRIETMGSRWVVRELLLEAWQCFKMVKRPKSSILRVLLGQLHLTTGH